MSVLIFIDHSEGQVKKTSLEACSYGAALAGQLNVSAEGILLGTVTTDLSSLGKYGVKKIHQAAQEGLDHLDAQVYAKIIADAATATGATVIVFSNNLSGKAVAPRVAARLKAGLVSGAVALPDTASGFVVKKNVFSGKAFAHVAINTPIKVIALNPNSYPVRESEGSGSIEIAPLSVTAPAPKVKVVSATGIRTGAPDRSGTRRQRRPWPERARELGYHRRPGESPRGCNSLQPSRGRCSLAPAQ
jgi:electron transfer flavoprotein alpha subunit